MNEVAALINLFHQTTEKFSHFVNIHRSYDSIQKAVIRYISNKCSFLFVKFVCEREYGNSLRNPFQQTKGRI